MSHTTVDAVRSILEVPHDDAPRLTYADWLDDHGDHERAAYVRWAIANPQNSAVCLCLNGRRQPQPCETCQMMGTEVAYIPRRADGETHYVVNRGLVAEVRLSLAAFLGGSCERCGGSGMFHTDYPAGPAECPVCSGTGRTEGVARRLFGSQPVERVVLTDRESYWHGGAYCWYRDDRPHPSMLVPSAATLPYNLFASLCSLSDRLTGRPSREAADAALSLACCRLGRRLAGLPELDLAPTRAGAKEER